MLPVYETKCKYPFMYAQNTISRKVKHTPRKIKGYVNKTYISKLFRIET